MADFTVKELVAEFTGTFLLIFTIGCNVLSKTAVWAGISIACVLMVAVFAFGAISGANFNPAVSTALALNGNLTPAKAGVYSAVQVTAGIAAGFCYFGFFGTTFKLAPAKDFNIVSYGLCELLYTFMLCFVVLNVAAVKKGCQEWFGLAIGFVIVAGAYGAGAVSGGCFNPAVALGIDVSSIMLPNHGTWYSLSYVVFELLGAALAVGAFKAVRPQGGAVDEQYTDVNKLLAEFIGTYVLVLTVGLNVLAKSPAGAFSIAASLMCMIFSLGDVSGANFNPAVTLALFINKQKAIPDAATAGKYMGAQIVGGIAAAFTYSAVYSMEAFPLGPGAGFKAAQALVGEAVFTFVLCLVVLCVAVEGKTKSAAFFALAIGSCVTVGGNAIGAISGGSLNPAVSFGIASAATLGHGSQSLVYAACYSAAEFVGAGAAAGLVMVTHAEAKGAEEAKQP